MNGGMRVSLRFQHAKVIKDYIKKVVNVLSRVIYFRLKTFLKLLESTQQKLTIQCHCNRSP